MEALKGFIFDHKEVEVEGKPAYKYLVSFILITDEQIQNLESETVIMGGGDFNLITQGLQSLGKYRPPYHLGDASHAILSVIAVTLAKDQGASESKEKIRKELEEYGTYIPSKHAEWSVQIHEV